MKIIIVGATGTLGKKVTASLEGDHEVIKAGSKTGDVQVDITSPESIMDLFKQTGPFDALISVAGHGHFAPLPETSPEQFQTGILDKLMGQVNLVLIGQHHIQSGGSFTLTSGILSDDPVRKGANLSAINGGINSFVVAASIELQNGIRINAVSPGVVEDATAFHDAFPGHIPVTMERVISAYKKSVLGGLTGQVIKVY